MVEITSEPGHETPDEMRELARQLREGASDPENKLLPAWVLEGVADDLERSASSQERFVAALLNGEPGNDTVTILRQAGATVRGFAERLRARANAYRGR